MDYDVIIVGTGIAGLYCALKLNKKAKILLITKDSIEKSNSSLAQGGISVLRDDEDFNPYMEDTLKAGHYKNDKKAVQVLIKESRRAIESLIKYGVDFDKNGDKILYTREGAHSINRIVHHKDITGKAVVDTLINKVNKCDNITIKEWTKIVDIVQYDNCCNGVITEDGNIIYSKAVVLATGGIGGLFKSSTNHRHITGDGLAIALKHNVKIKDLSYIQIHPTALYSKHKDKRRFLISEAVRGEGAKLLNEKRERFVDELLPRDIVTETINKEMNKFNVDHVYLDATNLGEKFIINRFPNIYKECLKEGYNMVKEPIPIAPAQHYFMGGIKVDLFGRTSLKGLFAVGETACTGVHGANRLASNSLLEALVFSNRVACILGDHIENINKTEDFNIKEYNKNEFINNLEVQKHIDTNKVVEEIKKAGEKFNDKWFKYA